MMNAQFRIQNSEFKIEKNDPARIPFECGGQQWC